jgi:hypothetical protein
MLKNRKLLIDQDCPMCNIYGKCFSKIGLIDKNTISPYQTIHDSYANQIDMERAKNEIALLDTETSTTHYGIDAMIEIVVHRAVFLKKILHSKLIYAFLLRLYRFISYNRKVIYPTSKNGKTRDCTPELNKKYRWTYIFFVAVFTGLILNQFAFHLNARLGWEHNWVREFIICFGQIGWQMTAISFFKKEKTLEYLGNMSTVSMIGGILLLPVLLANYYFPISLIGLIAMFGIVVGIMFFEHIRRCKLLGVPFAMTISWVGFRTIVLGIVLLIMLEFF